MDVSIKVQENSSTIMDIQLTKGKVARHTSFEQLSVAWDQIRLGKMTGSKWHKVISQSNFKFKADVERQVSIVVSEQTRGISEEPDLSEVPAIIWGQDNEQEALRWYEEHEKCELVKYAFIENDAFPNMGFSPDSYRTDRATSIQIKCPITHSIWIKAVVYGKWDPNYNAQCIFELALDHELESVDLVFFDPRVREWSKCGKVVRTFHRSELEDVIVKYQALMHDFNDMVEKGINYLVPKD